MFNTFTLRRNGARWDAVGANGQGAMRAWAHNGA